MKKLTLILALIGMVTLQSCSNDDDTDRDTISEVFEYSGVNFLPNDYKVTLNYPHTIFTSDMVLVYRLSGTFEGQDLWKLLPESYFFDDGTLDLRYDFDFRTVDAEVSLQGYDLPNVTNAFKLNQVLRVVVIPGIMVNNKSTINFRDYNRVVKAFNIDESKMTKIKQ